MRTATLLGALMILVCLSAMAEDGKKEATPGYEIVCRDSELQPLDVEYKTRTDVIDAERKKLKLLAYSDPEIAARLAALAMPDGGIVTVSFGSRYSALVALNAKGDAIARGESFRGTHVLKLPPFGQSITCRLVDTVDSKTVEFQIERKP